ncbi:hypothetical protein LOK49_LG05G01213 [Camellia lanceoleosa]|uniref:Uncharacterized protein n=1 Tax=Camellia lanceoleosa TaxID=1840588 RepID=A0ACC0HR79_9ERIC|nr:hypothetical protein LOK49_LG05G01213 [Camellia lanceoleosa]
MKFFSWPKMASFSGLGIGLVSVLGCIILALVAEFYYLLWLKKKRNNTIREEIEDHHHKYHHTITNYVKQLSHLFSWKKPNSVNTTSNKTDQQIITNNGHEQDLELGSSAAAAKERGINGDGEEEEEEEEEEGSVESELMRLHSICGGPPRFLFTIKEETKEDLESDDGRSRKRSRTRSLSDIVVAVETPMEFNPLFESSSPPPKFKFLRDAEEKLMRKLMEEAEKLAIEERDINNGSFIRIVVGNKNNNKEREAHQQCHSIDSTQVLPLDRNKPIEK